MHRTKITYQKIPKKYVTKTSYQKKYTRTKTQYQKSVPVPKHRTKKPYPYQNTVPKNRTRTKTSYQKTVPVPKHRTKKPYLYQHTVPNNRTKLAREKDNIRRVFLVRYGTVFWYGYGFLVRCFGTGTDFWYGVLVLILSIQVCDCVNCSRRIKLIAKKYTKIKLSWWTLNQLTVGGQVSQKKKHRAKVAGNHWMTCRQGK